ncbi:MAG: gp16 family protein [Aliiglaciecola sp.]
MSRPLIAKIHIAKKQLGLDDDTYRNLLATATGKTSCAQMGKVDLHKVLYVLESKGFKAKKATSGKKFSPKSGQAKVPEIDVIRAVWITMHKQGFVRDGSEDALDAYTKRMTVKLNKGQGVEAVAWLNQYLACKVLEALKQWHKRELIHYFHSLAIFRVPRQTPMGTFDFEVKTFTYEQLNTLYKRVAASEVKP